MYPPRRAALWLSLILLALLVSLQSEASRDEKPKCFNVSVIFEGRDYAYSSGDTVYYRWNYTVVGDHCITRGLSYWILDICDQLLPFIVDVSRMSEGGDCDEDEHDGDDEDDDDDEDDGDGRDGILISGDDGDEDGCPEDDDCDDDCNEPAYYDYEIGRDPKSGLSGIKWEHSGGNQLDKPGEKHAFWFVAPGLPNETCELEWSAKGGLVRDGGEVTGPCCEPSPSQSNRGACCGPWNSTACMIAYKTWCLKQGGIYMGDGTTCVRGTCATSNEPVSWGRLKALYR